MIRALIQGNSLGLILGLVFLSSLSQALVIPQSVMSQISCKIDPQLAKKWALSEIKLEANKVIFESSIETFFENTPTSELNSLCHRFLEQVLQDALSSISNINPDLVQNTLSRTHPKVEFSFISFCENRGVPIFAAACFKRSFLFGNQNIQVTQFHQDLSLKMFFPHIETKFSNQKSKLSLIHEFLHYFEWDQLTYDQHGNPYVYEKQDPVYACTNMALPGTSLIYSTQEKTSILLKQTETCRNHNPFRNR